VWRRLEPADFEEAYELSTADVEHEMWFVCDEGYEIVWGEIVAVLEYTDMSYVWSDYSPLEDVPDRFLKFGKLYGQADFEQAALDFGNTYGLPAGKDGVQGETGLRYQRPRMKVSHFREEARRVTRCEYCGRIISLALSHPEGRKRRRDKRFCDDACRQANHRAKKA
jgi:hypothetical protein